MSGDVLLRVDRVSKKFCRDLKQSLWYGLKDTMADFLGRNGSDALRPNEFWAVEGVSLMLRRGECLGLIGRNGAGKTTLLKMLNGLIKPDSGRIEIHGRVGALIALGAGFNPILTGRENIYVNGSVLGLPKQEIDARLDEIVEFAEIGDFIDSPVQSYSAGMQVRLGFSVATALRPDVLLLDEVLAVGDVAFRAKCYERLARMRDKSGFVLVSHDVDQIARVCSAVLVLDRGYPRHSGDVAQGLQLYEELSRPDAVVVPHEHVAEGTMASDIACDESVTIDGVLRISLTIRLAEAVAVADVRVTLWGDDGMPAVDAYSRTQGSSLCLGEGISRIDLSVGPLRLRRGRYAVSIAVLNRGNNLHLYWGDKVRSVDVQGPVAAAVPYTPALTCVATKSAIQDGPTGRP